MNNLYKTLVYPYQTINNFKPFLYRVGLSDIIKSRVKYDYSVNQNFRYNTKNKNSMVKQDEVLCSIYNLDLDLCYLFYTPYNGQLVNINYPILHNIDNIVENNEMDNWLFDIKIQNPYEYNTYS